MSSWPVHKASIASVIACMEPLVMRTCSESTVTPSRSISRCAIKVRKPSWPSLPGYVLSATFMVRMTRWAASAKPSTGKVSGLVLPVAKLIRSKGLSPNP